MTIKEPLVAGGAGTLPRLISVEEAAALLRVSDTTIRNWIRKDAIPYIELPGGEHRKTYKIPLQGLLNTLAGNYDLSSDLQHLDAVFGGPRDNAEQKELTSSRARARHGLPDEVEGDPRDLYEHVQVSSD